MVEIVVSFFKVNHSITFKGEDLLAKAKCNKEATEREAQTHMYVLYGGARLVVGLFTAVCSAIIWKKIHNRRFSEDGVVEINPEYVRGTSIYGHVMEFKDVNPAYSH